jgi:hypothetical protein
VRLRGYHILFLDNRLTDGGEIVKPAGRPLLPGKSLVESKGY